MAVFFKMFGEYAQVDLRLFFTGWNHKTIEKTWNDTCFEPSFLSTRCSWRLWKCLLENHYKVMLMASWSRFSFRCSCQRSQRFVDFRNTVYQIRAHIRHKARGFPAANHNSTSQICMHGTFKTFILIVDGFQSMQNGKTRARRRRRTITITRKRRTRRRNMISTKPKNRGMNWLGGVSGWANEQRWE